MFCTTELLSDSFFYHYYYYRLPLPLAPLICWLPFLNINGEEVALLRVDSNHQPTNAQVRSL